MLKDLEIIKSEYLSILRVFKYTDESWEGRNTCLRISIQRNRDKSVSSSISYDKLLRKVRYLTKRDLIHLQTISDIVIDDYSIDNIVDVLFKNAHKKKRADVVEDIYRYHHKQKFKKLKQEIHDNLHKRQNQLIINELKELKKFKKLKLTNLLKTENISQEDLKEIKRLSDLTCSTLKKLAQLRNIETTGLTK